VAVLENTLLNIRTPFAVKILCLDAFSRSRGPILASAGAASIRDICIKALTAWGPTHSMDASETDEWRSLAAHCTLAASHFVLQTPEGVY
jgi:hypothetical protein